MDVRNKKGNQATSPNYKINNNGTITIRNITYKIGIIKLIRGFVFLVAVLSLLVTLVFPIFLIVSVFFGLVGIYYTKMIKAAKAYKINNGVISSVTPSFVEEENNNSIDFLFGNQSISDTKSKSNTLQKTLTFKVAGVTQKNDENKDIKVIIRGIVKDIKENLDNFDLYGGQSNADIKEEFEYNPDGKVFELQYKTIDNIELVPDPTNQYDPNAIKVVSNEYGHIGYVPKSDTKKVHAKLEGDAYKISCTIVGGKYKYYDDEDEKVLTDNYDYGLEIEIS